MKIPHLVLRCFLYVMMMGMSVTSTAHADFVLNASCSSQISEAFQKEVLAHFIKENGINGHITVFSSEICLDRLRNGFSNMAGSTLKITRKDKDSGLIEFPVCQDSMAIIAHPSCGVDNLSLKQVRQVFSGYHANWKEVGGADMPIVLIVPAKDTGAYQNFRNMAMGPFEIKNDFCSEETLSAMTGVKYIPGAVSFITHAIAARDPKINVVRVDGVAPGNENYPYQQTFYMVIKGEPDAMMKEVINYIFSEKAQSRMIELGMKPLI